jgi:hypothetical protein
MLEHFVVQPDRQTRISNLAESLNKAKPAPKEDSTETKKDRRQEDMVELITKSQEAWTLPIAAAATEMKTAVVDMTSKQMLVDGPSRLGRPFACFFCEEEGHIKSQCPHLRRLINAGSVHLDEDLRICLGPPRPRAMPIQRMPGKTLLQAVERQVKMKKAPISALVGFKMIRVDLEEDSDVEAARPQKQTEGSKTCRQQVRQAEKTRRQDVASQGQTRGQQVQSEETWQQRVAPEEQTRRRQEVASEEIRRQRVASETHAGRQRVAQEGQARRQLGVASEGKDRASGKKKEQPEFTVPRACYGKVPNRA